MFLLQKPYKAYTYTILTIFVLTALIQTIMSAIWFLRIINFITVKGSPRTVFSLIIAVGLLTSIIFISLIIFFLIFYLHNISKQNNHSYIYFFIFYSILSIASIISGFALSAYGLSNSKCEKYVKKGICEGLYSVFDQESSTKHPKMSDFCSSRYYLADWQVDFIEMFQNHPSHFCKEVAVPVFICSLFHLAALVALITIYFVVKKNSNSEEGISSSAMKDNLISPANK